MDSTNTTSMETLVSELAVLLRLLDQENLSSATQEQKTAVRNLLKRIQPSSGAATEYIYVNSSVYSNGTLFVESLFDTFDCDLAELRDVTEENRTEPDPAPDLQALNQCPQQSVLPPASQCTSDPPPPLPTTPPPEEYYEEAVPLSPGKAPEYITNTRGSSSPPNSIEDGYEDTESYSPTCLNPRRKNSYNDSDALSSSYESYEEDEEERIPGASRRLTHQWPSDESSMPPAARDCRICAFLFRKKRFGQWAKQLTVIRDSRLQCYKSSKDAAPSIDLSLPQCSVVYAPKDARKKRHELRFTLPSGDTLVLAVQSREQAHRWLGVIKEVCNHTKGGEESNSPIILRKTELDKRLSGEKTASDSDGVCVSTGENCCRDARENGKVRRGALAAGRKITRIISFSKKKPPRPGDPSSTFCNDPRQGYLSVLVSQVWKELWCCVRGAALHFRPERGDPRPSLPPVALQGCEVLPGLGPKHPFALRVLKASAQVAALEAGSSEELGRWLGVLLAETGTAADPESLHYDYVDVETIANIRDAARHSFLWATSSSSTSIDSRTYDEVYEGMQPEVEDERGRPKVKPGSQLLRRPTSCSSASGKKEPDLILKRSGSNDPQYGRYGKTRAEEDAKRYRREKDELERERDGIRNALVTLRQQKREVKEEAKTATEQRRPWLSERLAQLEDSCRGKEAERVDLELQLTLVKENLNKSLAGGVLGAPREGKPLIKAPRSRSQNVYCESVPVHCASETRKRTAPPGYTSTNGTVMQKAKEWESKKGT